MHVHITSGLFQGNVGLFHCIYQEFQRWCGVVPCVLKEFPRTNTEQHHWSIWGLLLPASCHSPAATAHVGLLRSVEMANRIYWRLLPWLADMHAASKLHWKVRPSVHKVYCSPMYGCNLFAIFTIHNNMLYNGYVAVFLTYCTFWCRKGWRSFGADDDIWEDKAEKLHWPSKVSIHAWEIVDIFIQYPLPLLQCI